MERQKPGNDFDKVIARRPTTRRVKKETTNSECLHLVSMRARKFISATFGRAVVAVFGFRSKLMSTVLRVMGL